MKQTGFGPVIDARSEILILGSFPGQASLQAGHYYAHPRNQFWPLLSSLLGLSLDGLAFEDRYARLLSCRIALWDVLAACQRDGSLDADIRAPQANDFTNLSTLGPRVRAVLFNGRTAGRFEPAFLALGYETRVLPSTSPANAGISPDRKLAIWQDAFTGLRTSAGPDPR